MSAHHLHKHRLMLELLLHTIHTQSVQLCAQSGAEIDICTKTSRPHGIITLTAGTPQASA